MEVDDVVRLVRDIGDERGQVVIPVGTRGTIRQKAANGLTVEFHLAAPPPAVVSALVSAEDVEFQWCDPDNPLIRPGANFQPWLPRFRRRIAARTSKKAP